MSKLRKFFSASPKDLSMQKLSVSEIVNRMKQTDEQSMRLPRSFARTVSKILEHERSFKTVNNKE